MGALFYAEVFVLVSKMLAVLTEDLQVKTEEDFIPVKAETAVKHESPEKAEVSQGLKSHNALESTAVDSKVEGILPKSIYIYIYIRENGKLGG